MTLKTAGTQSITATDTKTSTITGAESAITVKAAGASILTVTAFPTTDTAGTGGSVVVTAYDPYGNVATGYTGTVSLASSDSQAILSPSGFTLPGNDRDPYLRRTVAPKDGRHVGASRPPIPRPPPSRVPAQSGITGRRPRRRS